MELTKFRVPKFRCPCGKIKTPIAKVSESAGTEFELLSEKEVTAMSCLTSSNLAKLTRDIEDEKDMYIVVRALVDQLAESRFEKANLLKTVLEDCKIDSSVLSNEKETIALDFSIVNDHLYIHEDAYELIKKYKR